MNWYKQAQINLTENIAYDIYSKISNNIEGSWTILSDRKMMPTFQLQSYRIITLDGKDVKKAGDYFWVEVKMFIYNALNILHPWSGTYENAENWQQGVISKLKDYVEHTGKDWREEEAKRWGALKKLKPEDSSTYNERYGNKLIEFVIQVYGKKPDGKDTPDSVNTLKIFFEGGDVEKIGVSRKGTDTPSEIAQYIQTTIDNYYRDDNDEDDRVETIDPAGGGYMEPEISYDQVDTPVAALNFASYKNWYKRSQQQYLWNDDPALDYSNAESEKEKWNLKYPKAGSIVSGLNVVGEIDNISSIEASLDNYYTYDSIREMPMSDFGKGGSYSVEDNKKSKQLAEVIKKSKQISPLIAVVDEEGPYILEGSHRFDALQLLNIQSFPALLVLDQKEDNYELV